MQSGKIRWLLALLVALAVAAPGGAVSGVDQKPAATKLDQGEPPQIQIIRRVSVAGVSPVERKVIREPREAGKTKVNSKPSPSTKFSASTVRANPVRSTPVRSTKVRATSVQRTSVRPAPGRA